VRQKILMVFVSRYFGNRVGWGNATKVVASWFHAISVAMESGRRNIVLSSLKLISRLAIQPLFLRPLNIPRHGRALCRNTVKEWVQNFRENSSALKSKPQSRIPTVRTPENVDMLRMATVKSARRSVRRNSAAIGLSDGSVRRILHKDLHFLPYKIAIFKN